MNRVFTYYMLRKYLLPIIIGPSSSPSYLLDNKIGGGRKTSRVLNAHYPSPTDPPFEEGDLFCDSRDSVRIGDNPKLKGGRSCVIRRKISLGCPEGVNSTSPDMHADKSD